MVYRMSGFSVTMCTMLNKFAEWDEFRVMQSIQPCLARYAGQGWLIAPDAR